MRNEFSLSAQKCIKRTLRRICILILGCKGLSNRYGNGQNDYSSWVIFLFHNGTWFCTFTERTQLLWFSLVFYRTEKDWDNFLILKRVFFFCIFPFNITPESHIKVMRIKEMITNERSDWLVNKFSLSAL